MASFLLTKDNKFKPGDIITQFKTPTWYFRPAKKWIDNINTNSATWKVISVAPNGDYTLQRLDTLDLTPLLEKDSPIYQKAQMNKEMIDNGDYRLWVKDDVDTIKKSDLDKAEKKKEAHDMAFKNYNKEMIDYFNKSKSIAETATKYNLTNAEILDALGDDKLKGATDYLDVMKELLRVANLPRAEAEYLSRATPAGGNKSKKRKTKRSKKRKQNVVKKGRTTLRSKKGRTTLRSRTTRRNSSYKL
jgi:hypothetical protein